MEKRKRVRVKPKTDEINFHLTKRLDKPFMKVKEWLEFKKLNNSNARETCFGKSLCFTRNFNKMGCRKYYRRKI